MSRCACGADRGATIQHWQLRDLVHCPSKDEELFCVYRHRSAARVIERCMLLLIAHRPLKLMERLV